MRSLRPLHEFAYLGPCSQHPSQNALRSQTYHQTHSRVLASPIPPNNSRCLECTAQRHTVSLFVAFEVASFWMSSSTEFCMDSVACTLFSMASRDIATVKSGTMVVQRGDSVMSQSMLRCNKRPCQNVPHSDPWACSRRRAPFPYHRCHPANTLIAQPTLPPYHFPGVLVPFRTTHTRDPAAHTYRLTPLTPPVSPSTGSTNPTHTHTHPYTRVGTYRIPLMAFSY